MKQAELLVYLEQFRRKMKVGVWPNDLVGPYIKTRLFPLAAGEMTNGPPPYSPPALIPRPCITYALAVYIFRPSTYDISPLSALLKTFHKY